MLKEKGFEFDIAHTSVLTRAIVTYHHIASQMDCLWIPHNKTWRLNERHYGGLTGLNKTETAQKYGEDQVKIWRRSYDVPPPELSPTDPLHPMHDRRYHYLTPDHLPLSESLKTTGIRVMPYWYDTIVPQVMDGKRLIVVAHGNSLRAIVKELSGMNEKEILEYNIPTGCPLVYEFDGEMKPIKNYYLLDEKELEAHMEAARKH